MGSATSTPTFQAKAANIQNADGTAIYNGGWTFKNASGVNVFQNTSTTGTGTDNCNLLIKADNRNGSMTCDVPSDIYVGSFVCTVAGTEKSRIFYRQSDKTLQFQGDGTTVWGTCINGAWTFGPAALAATGAHKFNGAVQVTSNATTGGYPFYAQNTTATAGVGTACVVAKYTVDTDCTSGYFYECQNSSAATIGRIEAASNTTTIFTGSSDSRLKINPSDFSGIDKVLLMKPREFSWVSNQDRRDKGFYAQELFEVYPEAVSVGNDDLTEDGSLKSPWGIDYGRLTPVLVKAIQEQQAMIEELKAKVAALEAK